MSKEYTELLEGLLRLKDVTDREEALDILADSVYLITLLTNKLMGKND